MATPGPQSGVVGTAAGVQVNGSDSKGRTLRYSASGLPAGLSINAGSGLISGTPSASGTSTMTVTASSEHASASATFTYAVQPEAGRPVGRAHAGGVGAGATDAERLEERQATSW